MVEATANLHEHTVQDAEAHAKTTRATRKKKASPRRRSPARVRVDVKVHPEVLSTAKALSRQRPGTRVRIVDAETVLVENVPTR